MKYSIWDKNQCRKFYSSTLAPVKYLMNDAPWNLLMQYRVANKVLLLTAN
jgi:hypothetical protein